MNYLPLNFGRSFPLYIIRVSIITVDSISEHLQLTLEVIFCRKHQLVRLVVIVVSHEFLVNPTPVEGAVILLIGKKYDFTLNSPRKLALIENLTLRSHFFLYTE